MLPSLLPLLASPETGGPLTLTVRQRAGEEIVDGSLADDAGHVYPIQDGIPRLLRASCATVRSPRSPRATPRWRITTAWPS